MNEQFYAAIEGGSWLERASDLLNEADPGPTPMLVDELLVAEAIFAIQGAPKTSKTWFVLELAVAIVTGRPAFGRFNVQSGPVVLVLEESGRAALHRRLGALTRGNAICPDELSNLHFAANRRVRLDDPGWQARLRESVNALEPVAVIFDPLARLKAPGRNENAQDEMSVLLDFMRELRELPPRPATGFVHHTGHDGTHLRGSSDLESYWETKIALTKKDDDDHGVLYDFTSAHREAEAGQTHRFRQAWDAETRSVRLRLLTTLEDEARAFIEDNPNASANDFDDDHGGNRQNNLAAFKTAREQVVPTAGTTRNHPVSEPPVGGSGEGGSPPVGGSPSGTTGLPAGSGNGNQEPFDLEPGWLARSLQEDE